MRITSMDITNKEFKKVMRGYSADEVDEFLDKIAEDYEALYKENSSLKEKITTVNDKVEHYAKMETTIQNTLLLAQNAAEQSRASAQKEADIIIKNANDSAQKILDKAQNDVIKINDDYDKVKQEFTKFRSKFRNFITTQADMFNSLERDFIKNYNVGNTIEEDVKEKEIDFSTDFTSKENQSNKEGTDFNFANFKEDDFNSDNLDEIKNFFVKGE
jgi:cell division initiation protein